MPCICTHEKQILSLLAILFIPLEIVYGLFINFLQIFFLLTKIVMELHVLIFYSGSLSAVYEVCLACDSYLKQYLLKYFRFAVLQFFDRCSYFVCVSYRWGFVCIQVPPAFFVFRMCLSAYLHSY